MIEKWHVSPSFSCNQYAHFKSNIYKKSLHFPLKLVILMSQSLNAFIPLRIKECSEDYSSLSVQKRKKFNSLIANQALCIYLVKNSFSVTLKEKSLTVVLKVVFITISHTQCEIFRHYNKELSGKQKSPISQRQPKLIVLYKSSQIAYLCIPKYVLKNYNKMQF